MERETSSERGSNKIVTQLDEDEEKPGSHLMPRWRLPPPPGVSFTGIIILSVSESHIGIGTVHHGQPGQTVSIQSYFFKTVGFFEDFEKILVTT